MAKVLFLAHRIPYPPDKGDKIRAFHMLRHLAGRHQVWLAAAADDADDLRHLPVLRSLCAEACVAPVGRGRRLLNLAQGLATGAPLSVARFRHPALGRWISRVLGEARPDLVFVYSSALGQYLPARLPPDMRLVVDFVDADAEKWRAYAEDAKGPMRWVYAREAKQLARFDRALLACADTGLLISETERRLMAELSPEGAAKLKVVPNGVDTEFFTAEPVHEGHDVVLCGRMDYAPNIEGADWFAREVLPKVRQGCPQARFRIVGAAPTPAVLALGRLPGVEVVGAVPDVRPYLAQAAAVVAPLRIARGIQNKVLEGMAAARPVIATPQALDGIAAEVGRHVLSASDADGFAEAVRAVLQKTAPDGLGRSARQFVVERHGWAAQFQALDAVLADAG